MANLTFSGLVGGKSRIYVVAGGGLLKSQFDSSSEISRNDFGIDAGGGVIDVSITDRVGIRGDIRYFRNVGDPEPDNEFDIEVSGKLQLLARHGRAVFQVLNPGWSGVTTDRARGRMGPCSARAARPRKWESTNRRSSTSTTPKAASSAPGPGARPRPRAWPWARSTCS